MIYDLYYEIGARDRSNDAFALRSRYAISIYLVANWMPRNSLKFDPIYSDDILFLE